MLPSKSNDSEILDKEQFFKRYVFCTLLHDDIENVKSPFSNKILGKSIPVTSLLITEKSTEASSGNVGILYFGFISPTLFKGVLGTETEILNDCTGREKAFPSWKFVEMFIFDGRNKL